MVSPSARRRAVKMSVEEGHGGAAAACRALGLARSSFYRTGRVSVESRRVRKEVVELSGKHPRYGYRRITALLRNAGCAVNRKRVERIWRREALKVPQRQPTRGSLWLADGSCIRLRPERANHFWAYNFVEDRMQEGRKFRMLSVVDVFTREALAIRVGRRLSSSDVIDVLADLFLAHGTPAHIRSDQGPEFIAEAVRVPTTKPRHATPNGVRRPKARQRMSASPRDDSRRNCGSRPCETGQNSV